jgi:hypothetical protein
MGKENQQTLTKSNRHTNNTNPTQNMTPKEHDQRDIELTATFDVEAARDYICENGREKLKQNAAQIADELHQAYRQRARHAKNEFSNDMNIHHKKAHLNHLPGVLRIEYTFDNIDFDIGEEDIYHLRQAVRAGIDSVSEGWKDFSGEVEAVYEINGGEN